MKKKIFASLVGILAVFAISSCKLSFNQADSTGDYDVCYYLENLDGEYDFASKTSLSGKAGEEAAFEKLEFPGFCFLEANKEIISATERKVVNVKYNRRYYTIKFEYLPGEVYCSVNDKFGKKLVLPENPIRDEYVFKG